MPFTKKVISKKDIDDRLDKVDSQLEHMVSISSKKKYYNGGRDVEILNNIFSVIGDKSITLIIDEDIVIDEDLEIPSNVTLYFLNKMKLENNITVQINGFIIDKPTQMFEFGLNPDSSNSCTILGLKQQDFIRPEWFGAIGDATTNGGVAGTDDSAAFQKTFNVAKSTKITKIKFDFKSYYIANTINISYFDLILEGVMHDKFETTDTHISSICFSEDLQSAFRINTDRGFGAMLNNLYFYSSNAQLIIFDFKLDSLPARNLTIEHCRFRGTCNRLFSFVIKEGQEANGTGVCTVTFEHNNFVGSGYCIYAEGKYALMNTNIKNNTIEWGMKFKSVNEGIGNNFVMENNLIETTTDLFDMSTLRTNVVIRNNYFESISGLFRFYDSISPTSNFEYNSNCDIVNCTYCIETNMNFFTNQLRLPSDNNINLAGNILKNNSYTKYNYTSNKIIFANEEVIKNDVFKEALKIHVITETDYVLQTKFGKKYLTNVASYGTLYQTTVDFNEGDVFILVAPCLFNQTGTTGYIVYDGGYNEKISLLSSKNFYKSEGFIVSVFRMNFSGDQFNFRFYEPSENTFYHSDIKVYKASDGKFDLLF